MTKESIKYINHIPIPVDDGHYDIMKYSTSFYGDDEELGTIIYMESSTKYKVKIYFKHFHYAFFASDESSMLSRYAQLGKLAEKSDIKLYDEQGFVIESENSELLTKMRDGSFNLYNHLDLEFYHYIIYTRENIIEVISYSPPEISIGEIEEWENGSVVRLPKD
ncbi:hypothetical protein RU86_GL001813 [Lactococcus piscium]|uniref:Uncharacterized protein n=1 Tax=Pseudolactococcus piscium TaxID=1364 RepID=A0A2A5RTT8_9LACT|nr:hypothetical protein [Lactococcus piscium]PCS03566.1 hypothetical protein RU86_GL001813 [Lactococcus piscium]